LPDQFLDPYRKESSKSIGSHAEISCWRPARWRDAIALIRRREFVSLTIKDVWSFELMERMFASSGLGLLLVAADGRLLDVNETFGEKLGYDRDELLGMSVAELTHPDDLALTAQLFQHASDRSGENGFEKRYLHRNGTPLWFKMRSEPVEADDGENQPHRIVMVEDITREKLDEINLELMAAITESSDDAVFRTDLEGRIQFWGKGAERLYGYTAAEVLGKSAFFLASEPDDESLMSCLQERIARDEVVINPDAITVHKDGRLLEISALIFPIRKRDGSFAGIAAVHRDISAFKQLQVELRHSQRLETAGLLAGGVAHDFNNIITVIKGAGYLLAEELPVTTTTSAHLQLIDRAAERAARLTRQLLAFSRKQKITPVVLDPNEHLRESVTLLTRTLGDDIRLLTDFASSWLVREDITQFEQVQLNLAVNARHAMPKGGVLTIRTRDVTIAEGHKFETSTKLRYTPTPLKPGSYVLLTVADTGVGMERGTLERIFDPFFTTRENGEGAGLGLSVVYGIVTQVGGGISVLTQPGIGSEFQIYLPRTESRVERIVEPKTPAVRRNSGRILVLEDDDTVRMLTSSLLKGAGYTVVEAANPRVVLSGDVPVADDFDLVLTDVMMPEMSGPEFSEVWLARYPGAKFLFMSGYFDSQTLNDKLTGKPLIQKPFKPADLLLQVARMLSHTDTRVA
jgi:two-component system cell cycle sensor histidine kinase/response regulator CckA